MFMIRFIDYEDLNEFSYKNLIISDDTGVIFKDMYVKNNIDLIYNNLNEMNEKMNLLDSRIKDQETYSYNLISYLSKDTDLKAKGALKHVQNLCPELLDFIANICDKYDINYWLDYGTLLGAVRHGGFIPWDDDLDIGMLRTDFNKLLEVLEDEVKLNHLERTCLLKLMFLFNPEPKPVHFYNLYI